MTFALNASLSRHFEGAWHRSPESVTADAVCQPALEGSRTVTQSSSTA